MTTTVLGKLITLARKESGRTSVMVPGAGGGLVPYLRLAGHLGQSGSVYAVRAAGLVPDEEPDKIVPDMVHGVLDALEPRDIRPDLLFGWSMGGVVAWEVGIALADRGHVPDLVLVDCSPFRRAFDPVDDEAIKKRVLEALGPRPDEETRNRVARTFDSQVAALRNFEVKQEYPGRVLLLMCTKGSRSETDERTRATQRWQELATDLHIERVDADHFGVFAEEHLSTLTTYLENFLGQSEGKSE